MYPDRRKCVFVVIDFRILDGRRYTSTCIYFLIHAKVRVDCYDKISKEKYQQVKKKLKQKTKIGIENSNSKLHCIFVQMLVIDMDKSV